MVDFVVTTASFARGTVGRARLLIIEVRWKFHGLTFRCGRRVSLRTATKTDSAARPMAATCSGSAFWQGAQRTQGPPRLRPWATGTAEGTTWQIHH